MTPARANLQNSAVRRAPREEKKPAPLLLQVEEEAGAKKTFARALPPPSPTSLSVRELSSSFLFLALPGFSCLPSFGS